ncbi:hypothetical protein MGYG_05089 [Nannizzia gypsea CBS 118893]|uniref:BTB domain-containing protein n=1 Tax=Arthroderma gypseum (strain ATCC MYA-4604 / CBS 118893) TaxID=535722 RepID=E4UYC3_ARTGP|nr:hypothetical protein MGYG_05089 [Nannizzia gypsea CBS 118893]EFR02086.1 hypothetical protein MGYG_05089 [Nannizzia gypsea CBS 118893]
MASVPGPDYRSIINSPQFTFLIGPGHSKVTIQSGLAKHVSPRLDGLMNNGHTRESRHRIAVLEDEDVETFTGFCEFAYTGDYTVPIREARSDQPENSEYGEPSSPAAHHHIPPPAPSPPSSPKEPRPEDSCAIWDDEDELPKEEPALIQPQALVVKEDPPPQPQEEEDEAKGAADAGKKGKKGKKEKKGKKKAVEERPAANTLTPPKTPPPTESKEKPKDVAVIEEKKNEPVTAVVPFQQEEKEEKPKEKPEEKPEENNTDSGDWFEFQPTQEESLLGTSKSEGSIRGEPFFALPSSRPAGVSIWDEFTAIQYPQYERRTHLPGHLQANSDSREVPYILYHAKIYVFASRYLVPALAQLALTKLHRELVSFPLRGSGNGHGDNGTIPHVLELLHYTFKNTKPYDPRFPSLDASADIPSERENRLRKLTTHYVACKVRQLATYRPDVHHAEVGDAPLTFRDLLNKTGELASNLVFQLM